MKIQIKEAKDKQFYFVIVAKNGETMACSEMYTRKYTAIKSATVLRDGMSTVIIEDCTKAKKKPKAPSKQPLYMETDYDTNPH